MSQQFSSGAAHLFVKFGGGAEAKYLGTAEGKPRQEHRPEYVPVMNDLSGGVVPLDYSFQGKSSILSFVLSRWNEAVARAMENSPDPITNGAGEWALDDVGTFLGLEGKAMEAWVVYPYANKAAYATLPAGYHYLQCMVWSPQVIEPGTTPMLRHFLLYAWPKLFIDEKKWKLWDHNITGLPAID